MTNTRRAMMCVIWIQSAVACGSSTSNPIGGGGNPGGSGGVSADSGAGSGGGGASGATGGNTAAGGGGGVSSGNGGSSGSGGASGSGGKAASGGSAGNGGSSASGGATSDAGTLVCNGVHPNVNGTARTCNSGVCYCSGTDSCFPEDTASACCKEEVVCGPGAVNPVATIYHPGDGETRAANVAIPFSGVGTDPQDGALSGATFVWTSSALPTPIGTGKTFNAALPAGVQVITLTVMDSDSNTGTDTITLNIQ